MDTSAPPRRPSAMVEDGRLVLQALALGVAVFAAARFCLALPHGAQRISPVWLPSAMMLALLLRTGTRRWPLLIAVGMAGHALAGLSLGYATPRLLIRAAAGASEYGSTALLVRRLLGRGVELDLERPRHFVVLCASAVGCAVAVGVLQAFVMAAATHEAVLENARAWTLSHPMCLMVLTPCLLVLSRPRTHLGVRGLSVRGGWALAGMSVTVAAVFGQDRFPILFVTLPVLVWVSLESGLYGAATAVLLTASVALPATIAGSGPVALSQGDVAERAAVLQLYLAVSLFSALPIAALQARWRRAEAQAQEEARRARSAEAAAAASEARHRTLTDQAPDAIGAMTLDGVLTFVSPAVETITGHPADELVGRDITALIDPRDLPRVKANLRRLLQGGEGGEPIEYRLRRKDGRRVWLQANPRVVLDEAGAPVGVVDVVRDISARKAMELELEAALEAARAGAQAKADFLANMSHELRTPLTGILGYAEVLSRDASLPATSRRHADRIGAAGVMLLALVNDVLDLSRAAAGGLALHPAPVDLVEVMQTSVDMIRPQAQKSSLALSLEHHGLPPAVLADPARLQQVLVNLLGNAVKFTSRGVVTTCLRWEEVGDALDVRLSVADTGIGIAADRLPHIFDRFEQADGSIARSFGGAGLGLAISRTLVRAMGGEITVESTPGAGSVFNVRLRLPRAEPAGSAVAEPQAAKAAAAPPVCGLRVLLAEDVAVNRELIALMLSPLDVRLHAVADGAQAVEAAAAERFDVVLMDMQMPVMDGLEATRRIRAGGGPSAAARIVALTANVLPEEVDRCLSAGMDDHLGKPLSAAALAAQLRPKREEELLAAA